MRSGCIVFGGTGTVHLTHLVMATFWYLNTFIDEEPTGRVFESRSKSWPQLGGLGHATEEIEENMEMQAASYVAELEGNGASPLVNGHGCPQNQRRRWLWWLHICRLGQHKKQHQKYRPQCGMLRLKRFLRPQPAKAAVASSVLPPLHPLGEGNLRNGRCLWQLPLRASPLCNSRQMPAVFVEPHGPVVFACLDSSKWFQSD